MTRNLSDARLAVHQRITDVLVGLFADTDEYTDEDVDTAAEIADELMNGLGLSIAHFGDGEVTVLVPIQ